MCFNSCEWLNFNPKEGEDKCRLPEDGTCPMDEEGTTEEEAKQVECCFCHESFEPWDEGNGDINDDACQSCDQSYQEGMEFDRDNFGANG